MFRLCSLQARRTDVWGLRENGCLVLLTRSSVPRSAGNLSFAHRAAAIVQTALYQKRKGDVLGASVTYSRRNRSCCHNRSRFTRHAARHETPFSEY